MEGTAARDRLFGEFLVEQGLAQRSQVEECLSIQERLRSSGVQPLPGLGTLLLQKGYISSSVSERTIRLSDTPRAPTPAQTPPEVQTALADPSRLAGKYVKLALLGRGGMGEVWKAWDRDLGRLVALKFLLGGDSGDGSRLLMEAVVAGGLNHPHIAQVYEAGTHQGRTYIGMQLIAGTTIAKAGLPQRALIEAVRDAAVALDYAHCQGVIHRDVKPENLMIAGQHVYVMDFGLARQSRVGGDGARSGEILGTPLYMSPEQARGESDRIDARSDVYSLGATLYALLVGRPPREGRDLTGILKAAASGEVVPPRRLKPSVPGELETVILKAMERDPGSRYATAKELADDLQRFLDSEPIRARPSTLGYRLRKAVARRKAAFIAGATGFLGILVIAAVMIPRWLGERAQRERDRTAFEAREASLKELGALWAQVALEKQGFHNPGSNPQKVFARIREAVNRVGEYLSRHPEPPQGWYVCALGRLYLEELDGAEADLLESIRREPGFAPGHLLLARVKIEQYELRVTVSPRLVEKRMREAQPLLRSARDHILKGRKEGGEKASIRAWGLPRTPDDEVTEVLTHALGVQLLDGDRDRARKILEEASAREEAAEYFNWLGRLSSGNPEEEIRLQTRALAMRAHYPKAYLERGVARWEKDLQGAIEDFSAALRVQPGMETARINRGLVYAEQGLWTEAIADYTLALEARPGDAELHSYRGIARLEIREVAGSVEDCSRAIELDGTDARAYATRGTAQALSGKLDAGLADCIRAVELDGLYADAYSSRAVVRFLRSEWAAALDDCGKAMELKEDSTGALSLRALIRKSMAEAEPARAKEHLRAALADVEACLKMAPAAWPKRPTAELLRRDLLEMLK